LPDVTGRAEAAPAPSAQLAGSTAEEIQSFIPEPSQETLIRPVKLTELPAGQNVVLPEDLNPGSYRDNFPTAAQPAQSVPLAGPPYSDISKSIPGINDRIIYDFGYGSEPQSVPLAGPPYSDISKSIPGINDRIIYDFGYGSEPQSVSPAVPSNVSTQPSTSGQTSILYNASQFPTTSGTSSQEFYNTSPFPPLSPDKRGIMEIYDKYMPDFFGGKSNVPGKIDRLIEQQAKTNITVKNPNLAVQAKTLPAAKEVFETLVNEEAKRLATPGMLKAYGPLALAATGVAAAAGAFKTKPAERPNFSKLDFTNYYKGLGPFTLAPSPPFIPVRTVKEGGIMSLEMEGIKFPKKQGSINGPGTGTSDSIPALLSDGEFVFTAKAVRGMGHGSRRRGAKRLYSLMKMLEERKG
jgi:hypothetical protein